MTSLTIKQLQNSCRRSFFWYIKGLAIKRLYETGKRNNSFTIDEKYIIKNILSDIEYLQNHYIENSNKLSIKAKLRCECVNCNRIAKYKFVHYMYPDGKLLCKHHMEEEAIYYNNHGFGIKDIEYYKIKN